jgi:gamma-glutamylcyclotransferase (GGCT)/AIG2-like uncharacterized protein YtfP
MGGPVDVFVYGTLRAGEANDLTRLQPRPSFLGLGVVRGRLFDYGHHPGLVLDEGGATVLGEVYRCAPELIPVLDRIELDYPERPGLFRRSWSDVSCDRGTHRCLLYEVTDRGATSRGELPPAEPVDWVSWRRRG